ncbi:hypothetical protein PUNSTDRAFT_138961 [Punctularia strigosozonata HHB-11173 SS5]|uniref:Golgi apparatus membrane protein TVP38 n=1 Tax=Punctularia strigosozonata (strain HHB-11173) TaxID=741275 RepID=R7S123_PUNST|nr:uncharacterized protein PUNSTDRAFT_138961 [Punctularia strigosozonata HHB-11173 SS5]EIN03918.1 hypothetical protein PUNSTDRAFT_138961 [Punctularia strigosozonata HHB-11173 SS5]
MSTGVEIIASPIPSIQQLEHARTVLTRTPSPSPTESEYLSRKTIINWKAFKSRKFWMRRERIYHYIAALIIIAIVGLFIAYQRKIVRALRPMSEWIKDRPAGWLIPIAVLFIVSFPPLLGHELIAILCGLVWGLGIGFGIVAAGTFIGELGNYYAFKYCCRTRAAKYETSTIPYACLTKIVRDGGFKIALISRYSIIPGHLTTAVYSTCGMSIGVFCAAAILSLPKQFLFIFVGVLVQNSDKGHGVPIKTRLISLAVVAVTIGITVGAGWYILREMNKVKDEIIYERRKSRQQYQATSRSNILAISTSSILDDTPKDDAVVGSDDIPMTPLRYRAHEHGAFDSRRENV